LHLKPTALLGRIETFVPLSRFTFFHFCSILESDWGYRKKNRREKGMKNQTVRPSLDGIRAGK
jgi:hypothetical protein